MSRGGMAVMMIPCPITNNNVHKLCKTVYILLCDTEFTWYI